MVMNKTPWTWLAMGIVFAWYGHSCKTSPEQSDLEDAFELQDSDELGETSAKAASRKKDRRVRLVHPQKSDAWFTRKSIMVHTQPSPEAILECKENAESIAINASNLRSLDEGALSLEGQVSAQPGVYHWCFYQLMTDLDIKLERDTPLLTEKSEIFLSRMRVLWVLAKALDATRSTDVTTYANYLRTRYIGISQNHFGRTVEVVDPEGLLQTAGKSGKSAGPYDGP